jgi:hypothetical protein
MANRSTTTDHSVPPHRIAKSGEAAADLDSDAKYQEADKGGVASGSEQKASKLLLIVVDLLSTTPPTRHTTSTEWRRSVPCEAHIPR